MIGILMLDTIFPRIRGDIGNPETFSFPVQYKVVKDAHPMRVVAGGNDRSLLPAFIAAARELEAQGVRAITTSCGFLSLFQQDLAQAVRVPVFASSLLQIPMVGAMLGFRQKIVIVTANRQTLSEQHLAGAQVRRELVEVVGLEDREEFFNVFVKQKPSLDVHKVEEELAAAADRIKENFPHAGAIVLECTNLPPFRHLFQTITGLPVFDIVTLTRYVYGAVGGHENEWKGVGEPRTG